MAKKKFVTKAEAKQIIKIFTSKIYDFDTVYRDYLHITNLVFTDSTINTNHHQSIDIFPTKYNDVIYVCLQGLGGSIDGIYIFQNSGLNKRHWRYREPVYDKSNLFEMIEKVAMRSKEFFITEGKVTSKKWRKDR